MNALAPLLSVQHLQITFPGREQAAVSEVSFEAHAGQCVALVGESGSGKSLTARAVLGLLPHTATQRGTLLFSGSPAPVSRGIEWNAIRGAQAALIPQDALGGLDPLRRIEHEVGDALRLHRIGSARDRRGRVVEALAEAGMPDPASRLRQRSDQLSGGLRQRALIASALIADPELIVADEPTTALDAAHRDRVLAAIRSRVDLGAAAILISHDLAAVREVADFVLVMRAGSVIESGTPGEVFAAPRAAFTRELIAASVQGKPRGVRLLAGGDSGAEAGTGADAGAEAGTGAGADASRSAPANPPLHTELQLELSDLTARYSGSGSTAAPVLDGVSLSVRAGETVGLVGPSGSGKTTLLRVALGLHRPESGSVRIGGIDRSSAPRALQRHLRRTVGLVPQDPLATFPRNASGFAILVDAFRAAGTPRAARRARAAEVAAEVGLDAAVLAQAAATLSGGQRQRLAIARALAREPKLLLLDEPVSALDLTVQARVLDLLDELQERHGTAYLFVSHDSDVVQHMSDRVFTLSNGNLAKLR